MALTKTEQELLTKIGKRATALKTASATTLKKGEFFKAAVAINPAAVKHMDKTLHSGEFILKLIDINAMVYRYLPASYKNWFPCAVAAIEKDPAVSQYISVPAERDIIHHWCRPRDKEIPSKNMVIFLATVNTPYTWSIFPYKDDKDVMTAYIKSTGHHLKFASERLQADEELQRIAYKSSPTAFLKPPLDKYRSKLVNDKEFVMQCMRDDKSIYIEPEYIDDDEVAAVALEIDVCAIWNLSERLQDNEEIIKKCVSEKGRLLQHASDRLCDNEEIVWLAVDNDPRAIEFASDRLLSDVAFASKVVSKHGDLLEYASDDLRDDKSIVMAAISNYPEAFEFASDRLKDDEEVAKLALDGDADNYEHLSERLQGEREFFKIAVASYGWYIKDASENHRDDEELAKIAIEETGDASILRHLSMRLRGDEAFVKWAVGIDEYACMYIAENLASDMNFITWMLNNTEDFSPKYMSESILNDKEKILELIPLLAEKMEMFCLLGYLPTKLRGDIEVATACVVEDIDEFERVSPKLKEDPYFVVSLMDNYEIDVYPYLSAKMQEHSEIKELHKRFEAKERFGL